MLKKKGRPPIIPQKIYEFDFTSSAKNERVASIKVKLLILEQIKQGKGYRETSKIFNVHETAIKRWVDIVEKEGLNGLRLKPGRGRKPKLKKENISDFKIAIEELQNNRSGGRINASDITKMANEKFGASYKVKGMYSLLNKIGMVWISSRSKHPAHNNAAQEAFKKTLSMR